MRRRRFVFRLSAYALEGLTAVTTTDLDRPTSGTGWDARTGVLHLADVADADART